VWTLCPGGERVRCRSASMSLAPPHDQEPLAPRSRCQSGDCSRRRGDLVLDSFWRQRPPSLIACEKGPTDKARFDRGLRPDLLRFRSFRRLAEAYGTKGRAGPVTRCGVRSTLTDPTMLMAAHGVEDMNRRITSRRKQGRRGPPEEKPDRALRVGYGTPRPSGRGFQPGNLRQF